MYTVEEFDKYKTKVLKYIMYKKRSEYEVRNKFSTTIEESLLEDIIEYLKEAEYLNDKDYIKRLVSELMTLKNMSIKEIKIKLASKGLERNLVEDYMYAHKEELEEYELKSARNIVYKKLNSMEKQEVKQFLFKKGYESHNIEQALEEIN